MRRTASIISALVGFTGMAVEHALIAALMMGIGFGLAYLIGRSATWDM